MIDAQDGWLEIPLGMSNYNFSIDEGFSEALKNGGKVFGRHAAWNFNALIYFQDGLFYSDIWRYRIYMETLFAPTLRELMELNNEKYGYD